MNADWQAGSAGGYGRMRRLGRVGLPGLIAAAIVLATATAAAAASVSVTPATGTATVGQPYCVTATLSGAMSPSFGFDFTTATTSGSAVAVPDSEFVPADPTTGQAQFCFTSATPGGVLVTATARSAGIGFRPQGTATVTFVAVPTDKDQCKDGGWQTFGVFKNQGDCVSFVATGGANAASGH